MIKEFVIPLFIITIIILISIIYILNVQVISQKNIELPQNTIDQKNTPDEKIIQIKYDEIPSYADSEVVNKAIIDAVDRWSTINNDLTIQITYSNDYDVRIEWTKILSGGELTGNISYKYMKISLGNTDCDNNWRHYSMNTISDTIAHEIGHYLELGHTSDINHLMYGETSESIIKADEIISDETISIQHTFDDLGYNIPLSNLVYDTWNVSSDLQIVYDKLMIKRETLLKEYNQYPRVIDNDKDYNDAIKIYDQLHSLEYEIIPLENKIYKIICQNEIIEQPRLNKEH